MTFKNININISFFQYLFYPSRDLNYGPPHGALCNLEVTEIYPRLSSMFLYASDTHLRQTTHTTLDLLGTYKNIVLVELATCDMQLTESEDAGIL